MSPTQTFILAVEKTNDPTNVLACKETLRKGRKVFWFKEKEAYYQKINNTKEYLRKLLAYTNDLKDQEVLSSMATLLEDEAKNRFKVKEVPEYLICKITFVIFCSLNVSTHREILGFFMESCPHKRRYYL